MADVRHQRKEGSAVSDRMRSVSKPIAVRSENLVASVKASNGSLFNGDGSTQVIFDIPAMSGGYYLDTAVTRFSFNVQLQSIGAATSTSLDAYSYLFLDRGPQSIINRFQLYDASGHLLEDIQNYHILYGLVKVCTGNRAVTEKRNNFFKECRNCDGYHETITGEDAGRVATTTTQRNVDPAAAFGGAIYKKPSYCGYWNVVRLCSGCVRRNGGKSHRHTYSFDVDIFFVRVWWWTRQILSTLCYEWFSPGPYTL